MTYLEEDVWMAKWYNKIDREYPEYQPIKEDIWIY